ncbi:MAG: hypothetical protein JRJ87_04320 [Deltaproteobacteria bacterium]|nr:hypothetical protein [Deltaproteobacteria bacterium]
MIFNRNLVAILILLGTPTWRAYAHDVEDSADKPLWSVGAGIGFGNVYSQTTGTYYGLVTDTMCDGFGCVPLQPVLTDGDSTHGQIFVERRLSERSSILMKLTITYSEWDSNRYSTSKEGWRKGIGTHLGYRRIFNPGGWIEFSVSMLIGGDWYWDDWSYSASGLSSQEFKHYLYVIGVGIGVALEKELLKNFYLRFESLLLSFSYTRVEARVDYLGVEEMYEHGNKIGGGLTLNPSVQLRLAF